MDFDFADMCKAIIDGSLKDFGFAWKKGYSVAPVAVSGGYPASYPKGKVITIDADKVSAAGAKVFIAGGADDNGSLVTSGGRVLACSCQGETFDDAWKRAYEALEGVHFDGMFYRHDIGLPGAATSD